MKKILLLVIAAMLFVPAIVRADTQAMDIIDTLEKANIEVTDKDYKEIDDQVVIYLFYSSSCPHCHDELEFLNESLKEYGSKFKLRAYEVTANEDNDKLMKKMKKFFNEKGEGVPFTVIGESTFYGFGDSTGEKMLKAIDTEYRKETKYDIFAELEKADKAAGANNKIVMIVMGVLLVFVIGGLIVFARKEA